MLVYIGTYTDPGKSQGIYLYRMDMDSGALEQVGVTGGIANPSWVTIHPTGRWLYAGGGKGQEALVAAFAIGEHGELHRLNDQPVPGSRPCHLNVDGTGRFLLTANYGDGSACVFRIRGDGGLEPASDVRRHQGSSVNPSRQTSAHAHSVNLSPDNRFAFVADLGMDKVMIYRFDAERGTLTPNDPPFAQVEAGQGPRHFSFHPSGRFAYLINELGNTVVAFGYDAERGALTELQMLSTLPADFTGVSYCAEVLVAPSGRFVYGSNRGHDSIVAYAVDERTGRLTYVGHEATQGGNPRGVNIDPTGVFLLAANQDTDTIATFRLDPASGKLLATGHVTEAPTPVCIKFLRG